MEPSSALPAKSDPVQNKWNPPVPKRTKAPLNNDHTARTIPPHHHHHHTCSTTWRLFSPKLSSQININPWQTPDHSILPQINFLEELLQSETSLPFTAPTNDLIAWQPPDHSILPQSFFWKNCCNQRPPFPSPPQRMTTMLAPFRPPLSQPSNHLPGSCFALKLIYLLLLLLTQGPTQCQSRSIFVCARLPSTPSTPYPK